MEDINDIRTDFKGVSFSNYKKSDVKKELLNSLYNTKFEQSCYWSSELICSGHFLDLWDLIIIYMGKYIHLGNPKLPIYIEMRFNNFKEILTNGYIGQELFLRNNEKIRKLFSEVICVLCDSNKKHSFENIKLNKDEFDITNMQSKLKAPHIKYIDDIFQKDDPKELFIPLNEFGYQLSIKDSLNACYWVEWILEFETICKKKKETPITERRTFAPVDEKFQKDSVWIIWEIILNNIDERDELTKKIINKLLDLFCIRFTNGVKKRRKHIIFFSISLITENYNKKKDIINNKNIIEGIVGKINNIYKQIKKNEVSPNTDYLFANVDQKNAEKSLAKIEKMKEILNK
tara:strand:- start:420 stop:1457 length:1038 start_codon:yes stop_codon:yes gene_type:complete